jgi:GNAT superfamily N-acetyltransferase
MPTIRRATPADAALITEHRHRMFSDNNLATEARYAEMDKHFLPWVEDRLANGCYAGLILEDPDTHQVLASAGIFYMDFPPHYLDPMPCRAYLLNFYTAPEDRGMGYAKLLLNACVEECRGRNIGVITLHASRFGKPIYEKAGFTLHNEYTLRPDPLPPVHEL